MIQQKAAHVESPHAGTPAARAAPGIAIAMGLGAALLFTLLAGRHLEAQGLYHDELHQATGSFHYFGAAPMGVALAWGRVPVLNMPYSGAIKTGLYAAWLALSDGAFSPESWRLLGILITAAGMLLFCWLARRSLPPAALALLLVLMLSDGTLLLASRHDWGPVALALFFRLALAGLWVAGLDEQRPLAGSNGFAMGGVVGLAIFEKLSSVVLLVPLALFWLADPRRRSRRHTVAMAGGLAVGSLPLLIANALGYRERGDLISLSSLAEPVPRSFARFSDFAGEYLSLGNGAALRAFILGDRAPARAAALEPWLVALLLVVIFACLAVAARRGGPALPGLRHAALAALAYLGVGLAVYALPRGVWVHHWVIGTPFQYLAVALALAALWPRRLAAWRSLRPASALLAVLLVAWLPLRATRLASLEGALARGASSRNFDPELNALGRFAGAHAGGAFFAAGSWGVASPVFCFAGGARGSVAELFWHYPGPFAFDLIERQTGKEEIYLIALPANRLAPELDRMHEMERDLARHPGWRPAPLPPELAELERLRVRRYLSRHASPLP